MLQILCEKVSHHPIKYTLVHPIMAIRPYHRI